MTMVQRSAMPKTSSSEAEMNTPHRAHIPECKSASMHGGWFMVPYRKHAPGDLCSVAVATISNCCHRVWAIRELISRHKWAGRQTGRQAGPLLPWLMGMPRVRRAGCAAASPIASRARHRNPSAEAPMARESGLRLTTKTPVCRVLAGIDPPPAGQRYKPSTPRPAFLLSGGSQVCTSAPHTICARRRGLEEIPC